MHIAYTDVYLHWHKYIYSYIKFANYVIRNLIMYCFLQHCPYMVWGVGIWVCQQQTRHSRQLQPSPSKLEHWHQRLHQESHCTLVCIAGRLIVVWIGNESRNNAFECNQLEDRLRDQGCCGMLLGSCWGVFLFLLIVLWKTALLRYKYSKSS